MAHRVTQLNSLGRLTHKALCVINSCVTDNHIKVAARYLELVENYMLICDDLPYSVETMIALEKSLNDRRKLIDQFMSRTDIINLLQSE